jgi:signal transduction histidine kinase
MFERFSLANRILLLLASLVAILGAATLYIGTTLDSLGERFAGQERIARAGMAAHLLEMEVLKLLREQSLDTRNPRKVKDFNPEQTASQRANLRELTDLPDVLAALDAFEALVPKRIDTANKIAKAIEDDAPDSTIESFRSKKNELDDFARTYVRSMVVSQSNALDAALAEQAKNREVSRRNINAALMSTLLLVVGVCFVFARGLGRRFGPLLQMANKAAQGDLSNTVTIGGSDEIARLGSVFNKMAEELAERNRSMGEFVALAAHHLHTPVSAIRTALATLLDGGDLTAEQKKVIGEAYQSNQRQLAFIDNLLMAIESDSGSLMLSKSETDLYRLVDDIVAQHQSMIDSRNQRIAIKDPGHPIFLTLDAPRIRNVLQNLVTNASQHTPEGGRIDVALTDYGTHATVSVRDTGVGISQEDLKKLFKKFSRVSSNIEGSGLGLYLASQVVKLHGGEVTVESELGKGSRFIVRLPKAAQ